MLSTRPTEMQRPVRAAAGPWMPWWLHPLTASAALIGIGLMLFVVVPEDTFLRQFRQQKSDLGIVLPLLLSCAMALFAGMVIGDLVARQTPQTRPMSDRDTNLFLRALGWAALVLTLVGYAVYLGTSKASVDLYLAALSGQPRANFALKMAFEKLPGITSFMSLACWWFVYVAHHAFIQRRKLTVLMLSATVFVALLCLLRAFAVNERRVVFETIMPAVIYVVMARRFWSPASRSLVSGMPVYGAGALILVFMVSEYFRSWVNFYSGGRVGMSYLEWSITRLGGYYTTAINNSAALFDSGVRTHGLHTFGGWMKMPILGDISGLRDLRNHASNLYTMALQTFTNEEFNSPGGITAPVLDFGYAIGLPLIFVTGLCVGATYVFAVRKSVVGILFYCIFFFAITELMRLWHFGSANAVISVLFLVGFWVCWSIVQTYGVSAARPDWRAQGQRYRGGAGVR